MPIKNWSTTAASNNSAAPNGAPEGMAPAGVNDTIRQNMADIRTQFEDAPWFDFGNTPTRTGNTTFTVSGDYQTRYAVGKRIRCTDSSTLYGTISNVSYSAPNTTVTVTLDSGNLSASLTAVALAPFTSNQVPDGIVTSRMFDAAAFSGLSAESSVDTADILPIKDVSEGANNSATVNDLFKAVNTFTAETSVDKDDVLPLYDASASTGDKCTVGELLKSVNTLTEDTTPDPADDFILIYDASATSAKKAKFDNLTRGQIKFPATQNPSSDANTLDDYEEGTFTPTWTATSVNPAIGNGSITGSYIKIGKFVRAHIVILIGNSTTFGTGDYRFGNLPFASANQRYFDALPAQGIDAGTGYRIGWTLAISATSLAVMTSTGSFWSPTVPHTWAVNDEISINISYIADA